MANNLAYAEELWEELIDGKPVLMTPRPALSHTRTASNIYFMFRKYLKGRKCEPFPDGVEVYLNQQNRFIPDMMVVCDPEKIKQNGVHGAPDLVVEVLSPRTMKNDRGPKMAAYSQAGVREYWLVDTAHKAVEQYLQEDGQLQLAEVWYLPPDAKYETLTDEDRAALVTSFKCSLYDDLLIDLYEVFERVE